jgi:hypothetical protein
MALDNRIIWKNTITTSPRLPRVSSSLLDVAVSMQRREEVLIVGADGVLRRGVVNMIEAEDGSGYSFNIEFVGGDVFHCRFA